MKEFKNNLVEREFQSFINQSTNLVKRVCDTIQNGDKRQTFSTSDIERLGLEENIKSLYDYQIATGFGYTKLYAMAIISICSDVEYLLKVICEEGLGITSAKHNSYQKIDYINAKYLVSKNMDLTQWTDFDKIKLCFQIRHIYIHNMGYIDNDFNKNTNLNLQLESLYEISSKFLEEVFDAMHDLYYYLDDKLECHYKNHNI